MADSDENILINVFEMTSAKERKSLLKGKKGEHVIELARRNKIDKSPKPGHGAMMLVVATNLDPDMVEFADHLVGLIVQDKIPAKTRIQLGLAYLKKKGAKATLSELDEAIGLGIDVSEEDVIARVAVFLEKNDKVLKAQRYGAVGRLLGQSRADPVLQFADALFVKTTLEAKVEEILGPKTKEDLDPKKKKKKQTPPAAVKATPSKSLNVEEKTDDVDTLSSSVVYPPPEANTQKTPELLEAHLQATGGRVITRFPPEPNGYLHIGHAKSMNLNFGYAARMDGLCYLRFDDTNPAAEKQEYIDNIIENVEWMGFKPYKITYSSDYFDQLYELACKLVRNGDGYVCSCPSELMRKLREEGTECEHRSRSVDENLQLFEGMRDGKYREGEMCMRMKGDMKANNTTMRDLVAYRILHMPHPHVGDKWCIYPSYDFTHCIVDSLENITHSLCTLEFRIRRESYEWLLHQLHMYCPPQREFSRLVLTHVMLSKRKLKALVESGRVDGWDDPRLPTLRAYRRRGYTPEAIRDMCNRLSVTGAENTVISHDLLDYTLRLHLDAIAPRKFMVIDPLKITITNFPEDRFEKIAVLDFPTQKDGPIHEIVFSKTVYIERSDFREVDDKNYYGLAPNKEVRLKYGYHITCTKVIKDDAGNIVELEAEYDPENSGKPKGTLHWVADTAPGVKPATAEVRLYDTLFLSDKPWELKENWLENVNPDSKHVFENAFIDPSLCTAKSEDKFQFERLGYFCVDWTSTDDKLIFNRTVSLKSTYKP